ncbi:hypothetical protein L6164_035252 [Bauhinia variegata]|uniref:Uncharacterized protein n=1 Tax=Bauhinia variegata TaxID=167791 RepID=A0ACB9KY45_BAUVA|nr:hypothetical protein L6164_035252 [Bauhinia variegata]
MLEIRLACPVNSNPYNGSPCACPPGYVENPATKELCTLFTANTTITTDSGVDTTPSAFPRPSLPSIPSRSSPSPRQCS